VLIDSRDRHWIERQALSYAPSVTALGKMMERAASGALPASAGKDSTPLLAVGRPDFGGQLDDLPATEVEVKAIAAMFHVEPLLGKRATKARARAQMLGVRYLHFATHGLINEASPMYSAIALTREPNDDGLLTARELMDASLTSELVVLSACETALGKQTHGEGVLGLTWALFVAGARSSVVTQWSVEDESTSELMTGFYGRLGAPSTGKAEALRQAQLKVMKDGKHAHPYFWAPFILDGSWD
jgi:CHAT domain-containing protein